jgi:hypothetical protein
MDEKFTLRYLPLFEQDLAAARDYIAINLNVGTAQPSPNQSPLIPLLNPQDVNKSPSPSWFLRHCVLL